MQHKIDSRIPYIISSLVLFVACIYIVRYSQFLGGVRGWLGDIVITMLLYVSVQSFRQFPIIPLAIGVLLISYGIEILQYYQFASLMGWESHSLARLIFGSTFDINDLLSYTIGVVIVSSIDYAWRKYPGK